MKNQSANKTPQATHAGDGLGGSVVRGLLGAFCLKGRHAMHKEIDCIRLQGDSGFDLFGLKYAGIEPLKVLSKNMIHSLGSDDLTTACGLLHEQIFALDEKINQLIEKSPYDG